MPPGPRASGFDPGAMLAWSELTSAVASGSPGAGAGMVFNATSGSTIIFGGQDASGLTNSTQSYTESTDTWATVAATGAPSPRSNFAFGLDSTNGRSVLFGGLVDLSTDAVTNDTWSYDLATRAWTNETGPMAPAAREDAAFAVDPSLGIGVLYGGQNPNYEKIGTITYSDLWEVNLSTFAWTQVVPGGAVPPPLEGASLTWDPSLGVFQMFGGCAPCSNLVWEFDPHSETWTQLPLGSNAPSPVAGSSWTYDPGLSADLLFGGTDGTSADASTSIFYPSNDSWVAETLPGPTARWDAASAYLSVAGNATWLLVGGTASAGLSFDLWRLSATVDLGLRVENASQPNVPISDSNVTLDGAFVGATNAEGYLNLTQVNGVDSTLGVADVGYFTNVSTLWLAPGSTSQRIVLLTVIPPRDLGTIHVSALGPDPPYSPIPIVDGEVNLTINGSRINAHPVLTGSSGMANFTRVPPGTFNVSVWAQTWRSNFSVGVIAPGATVNLTIELFGDPVILVNVTGILPGGGAPVPLQGVSVYLNGAPFLVTPPHGEIEGSTTAYGWGNLTAFALGFSSSTVAIDVPWTGRVNASLVLDSLPAGAIDARVIDKATGEPLAGAEVEADSSGALAVGWLNLTAVTNSTGWGNVSALEGFYEVSAIATGFVGSTPVVEHVLPNVNRTLTIQLVPVPGANLAFLVEDASDLRPIAGANVTVATWGAGRTDAEGYYNASQVPPGVYVVSASAVGFYTNTSVFTFYSYENATVPINLTPIVYVSPPPSHSVFQFLAGNPNALWALLLVPAVLALGGFVYLAATRGGRAEYEEPTSPLRDRSEAAEPPVELPR